jgi:multiple sugar transport system substrate-binding protein
MQWKSPRSACLFFLASVGLTGCGGQTGTVEPLPPQFGRVRVACHAALSEAVVKPYARNWEGQTGGELEIVPYDPGATDPPDADVWLIPAFALPRWAAADQLRLLPDSITSGGGYSWSTLLPLYRDKLAIWDRKRFAMPLLGESLLCCYRSDWLADPKHQAAFAAKYQRPLEPPATWEQFADIAEYFSRDAQAEKVPSLPPLPVYDDERERTFYTIAANYAMRAIAAGETTNDERLLFSFQYDSTSGEPRLATGGFVHALQLLKRLQTCRPPGEAEQPAQAFTEGRAVFCLTETAQLAVFQKSAKVKDRFGVCRLPGADGYYNFTPTKTLVKLLSLALGTAGGSYYDFAHPETNTWVKREGNRVPYLGSGGWLGVVPKSAADEKAAFSLLAHLTGPAVSKQIVIDPLVGGGPTRQDHLDSATRWDAFGLDAARTTAVKEVLRQMLEHPGLKNPALHLRTPDEATHRRALQEELRAALKGDKTPEKALQDAAARWAKMDRDKGLAAHRAEVRISLGLLPKD